MHPGLRAPRGATNQTGLRSQNARLVLSLIRRTGEMPSAEIARCSGLSAQTVSNIIRDLEGDGLLLRGEAQKGKVGKPSIPMSLNPMGGLSLGLSIGRRSMELTLVDFVGKRLDARSTSYAYPVITDVLAFLRQAADDLMAARPGARDALVGIGVSMPDRIWEWLEAVDAPAPTMQDWQTFDVGAAVADLIGLDAIVENDANSACIAELLVGRGNEFTDFAYIFLGAFVGGGLVLNGNVVAGRSRNGTALGSMPMPDGAGGVTQLLDVASLYALETELRRAGRNPLELREMGDDWSSIEDVLDPWIETTGRYLSLACGATASLVDVEAVMIDGAMPAEIRDRLTQRTRSHYLSLDRIGLEDVAIEAGSVGRQARSIGAAILPIHSKYFLAA